MILQAAISTERLKALEWMERHNREKENLRELQVSFDSHMLSSINRLYLKADVSDARAEMEAMHTQHLKDQEEIKQLAKLYKVKCNLYIIVVSCLRRLIKIRGSLVHY